MKQSALQELIERLQVAYERGDKKYKPAFEYWLNEAKNLLPKERQDIIVAFKSGFNKPDFDAADNYFNQTFTTKK